MGIRVWGLGIPPSMRQASGAGWNLRTMHPWLRENISKKCLRVTVGEFIDAPGLMATPPGRRSADGSRDSGFFIPGDIIRGVSRCAGDDEHQVVGSVVPKLVALPRPDLHHITGQQGALVSVDSNPPAA